MRPPVGETDLALEPPIGPLQPGYPSYRGADVSQGFQLLDYWRAIRKRLWLVIGVAVLLTTLTAIYIARKPNIYQARARVQVDLEQVNPDLVTSDRQRPMSNPDPAYFNTQLQLLSSNGLLRRVIKEKDLDANKEFQQLKTEGSASAWRSLLRSLGLATDDSGRATFGGKQDPAVPESPAATSEEVAEAIRLAPYVQALQDRLEVQPVREARTTVKDTRLIDISFTHTNAQLAAYVVNSIAEVFTISNQEKRQGSNRKTNDFLQERIATLEGEIKQAQEQLVELTKNAGILKTSNEQTIVIDRLAGLNKQLLEAEDVRKDAEAKYAAVANNPEKAANLVEEDMARFITEQENSIRQLKAETRKKVAELNQNRAQKLQEYQEGAPEIKELDVQIASLNNSLDKAVADFEDALKKYRDKTTKGRIDVMRTKYQQAKAKEDKIRADYTKQYAEAQAQNGSAVDIKILQQDIDTKTGFLDKLRGQISGNDVAAKGSDNNISVVEVAVPPNVPISPRRLLTVLMALVLSTVFGMGLALFLEYLDDTIRTTEEVESYLQLPALAAIPTLDSLPKRRLLLVGASDEEEENPHSPLLITADSRSALAEAYRHLRTSILLSTAGRAPKTLLITSSLPAEGKTTTATNTAISLAQTGSKVLIIDADMRRPRLHSIFSMSNGEGLSTLLASELTDRDIKKAVQQDEKSKLYVMPSGPIPPNPAELIGSEQMALLLRRLQNDFTHVVLDSPPIASFTDGVLIASMVDGVILVVHAGKSSRQVVRRSRQLLNEIGAKIFGVVLNNVNLNTQDNYYYYQSYYHRNEYYAGEDRQA